VCMQTAVQWRTSGQGSGSFCLGSSAWRLNQYAAATAPATVSMMGILQVGPLQVICLQRDTQSSKGCVHVVCVHEHRLLLLWPTTTYTGSRGSTDTVHAACCLLLAPQHNPCLCRNCFAAVGANRARWCCWQQLVLILHTALRMLVLSLRAENG
jgi:hypothetical protein